LEEFHIRVDPEEDDMKIIDDKIKDLKNLEQATKDYLVLKVSFGLGIID
jgi:hypothetical protein